MGVQNGRKEAKCFWLKPTVKYMYEVQGSVGIQINIQVNLHLQVNLQ